MLQANSVKFLWNAPGTAVLGLAISDEDKSGQSYYGEQHLHFLAADGSNDCLVPLPVGPDLLVAMAAEDTTLVRMPVTGLVLGTCPRSRFQEP